MAGFYVTAIKPGHVELHAMRRNRRDNPTGIAACTDRGALATPMMFRFADPRF
jgi:hypothetical protein